MKLIVDTREPDLLKFLQEFSSQSDSKVTAPIVQRKLLEIGDCLITNDDETVVYMVIERKTMGDLASSLYDGRWSEQKKRALSHYTKEQLFYIIETATENDIFFYRNKYSKITGDALLSATMNLTLNYHIPYVYLQGIENVSRFIYRLCIQCYKKEQVYDKDPLHSYDKSLLGSVKSQKNKNMTPAVFFLYCLQGVPGISYKTAKNISGMFDDNMLSFIDTLRDDPSCEHLDILYKKKYGRSPNKTALKIMSRMFLSDVLPESPATSPLQASSASIPITIPLQPNVI